MTIASLQKVFLDQMGNHLGIGFGVEAMTLFNELSLQRNVVLDNPVVNHDDSSSAVTMWVSVFFRGTTVRGPAGVTNSVSSIEGLEADHLFQIPQLTLSAANLQTLTVAAHCDPGRIITAILQPFESVDDDRHNPLLANISHNAAHSNAPIFGGETEGVFCELESGHYFRTHTRTHTAGSADNQPAEAGQNFPTPSGGFG